MKHNIQADKFAPLGEGMAKAVTTCIHCGYCLSTCPTYSVLNQEMDSPRGRIVIMKSVLEGSLELEDALPYIDRCLGCLGCVTACPSGVAYNELLFPFRAYVENQRKRSIPQHLIHHLTNRLLTNNASFRKVAKLGNLGRVFQRYLPNQMQSMLSLLPTHLPTPTSIPFNFPPLGSFRLRVALLSGCVQHVLKPSITQAALKVLSRNGVEAVVPPNQSCCGALAWHTGDITTAIKLGKKLIDSFPSDIDTILTTTAGCGSCIKKYEHIFADSELAEKAKNFSSRVEDICVFLDRIGIEQPPPLPVSLQLAYHDACHLIHAQGISAPPRQLLQAIPNLTLLTINQGDICCGSAGSYNFEQPNLAQELGKRKVQNIIQSGAAAVAMGNIGCMVQIQAQLNALTSPLPVYHTIEVLALAYR